MGYIRSRLLRQAGLQGQPARSMQIGSSGQARKPWPAHCHRSSAFGLRTLETARRLIANCLRCKFCKVNFDSKWDNVQKHEDSRCQNMRLGITTAQSITYTTAQSITIDFIEADLRSQLQEDHLNLVTRTHYLQKWWTVHDFPYNEALDAWRKAAHRYTGQSKA